MSEHEFIYDTDELESLKYAKNYYNWIMSYFKPHLGRSVVEVGAGIGTFSDLIIDNINEPYTLSLYEPAGNNFEQLEKKYNGKKKIKVYNNYFEYSNGNQFDTLIVNNVLEHIEDEDAIIKNFYKSLLPSGKLLIYVPALDFLYSEFDKDLGHYRRYSKDSLQELILNNGFKILEIRYFNILGVLSWYLVFKVLKKKTINVQAVKFYDKYIIPVLRKFESIFKPPLGQNLLLVAQKE
ncbi:MAG: class I SAM-dependent methyltransferase [Candidatus Dadabacteria bacterium]|nr:class I SAM-dependent methyltransferase [Candidatus Dadabacteria bacterium]NIV43201.1 methyltransferase domain-containing protein [Candidatus Dadabacteria bacterium]NIX16089.1 methyltransferase domain-containing protein [Candidatus Dadabacteria bacterium]